jgi:hypothetical protein
MKLNKKNNRKTRINKSKKDTEERNGGKEGHEPGAVRTALL